MIQKSKFLIFCMIYLVGQSWHVCADETVKVTLDVSETPNLAKWGKEARELAIKWHPRIQNLIPTKNIVVPNEIKLIIRKSDKGLGGTVGTVITLSSSWIEKHPDDLGLVIHELVHVIQSYPSAEPWWLTEGIADYLRWGIYEGKKQSWFPRPKEKQGYRKGYRVAAGFLMWLESDIHPGIVKKLNTAMRKSRYSNKIFADETGRTLDQLWDAYVGAN